MNDNWCSAFESSLIRDFEPEVVAHGYEPSGSGTAPLNAELTTVMAIP